MQRLVTEHFDNTLRALESAVGLYKRAQSANETIDQEVYRMAIVKGFDLAQEVAFKLLRRRLRDYGYGNRTLQATPVKALLRLAAQHGLMSLPEVERWFAYRDNRNDSAHDYGEAFTQETLALLGPFIEDARALSQRLRLVEADTQ